MNRTHAESNVGISICYLSFFSNCNQNCNESTECSETTPTVCLCGKISSVFLKLLDAGRWIYIWRS